MSRSIGFLNTGAWLETLYSLRWVRNVMWCGRYLSEFSSPFVTVSPPLSRSCESWTGIEPCCHTCCVLYRLPLYAILAVSEENIGQVFKVLDFPMVMRSNVGQFHIEAHRTLPKFSIDVDVSNAGLKMVAVACSVLLSSITTMVKFNPVIHSTTTHICERHRWIQNRGESDLSFGVWVESSFLEMVVEAMREIRNECTNLETSFRDGRFLIQYASITSCLTSSWTKPEDLRSIQWTRKERQS